MHGADDIHGMHVTACKFRGKGARKERSGPKNPTVESSIPLRRTDVLLVCMTAVLQNLPESYAVLVKPPLREESSGCAIVGVQLQIQGLSAVQTGTG